MDSRRRRVGLLMLCLALLGTPLLGAWHGIAHATGARADAALFAMSAADADAGHRAGHDCLLFEAAALAAGPTSAASVSLRCANADETPARTLALSRGEPASLAFRSHAPPVRR